MADDLDATAREVAPLDAFATDVFLGWELAETDWWRRIAGVDVPGRTDVPEPFARMADGDWLAAAAVWERLGCPWWQGVCLSRSDSVDDARAGTELLAALGAVETRSVLVRDRRRAGQVVPRGPRQQTRTNPAGLTARELRCWRCCREASPTPSLPIACSSRRRPSTTTSPPCCGSSGSPTGRPLRPWPVSGGSFPTWGQLPMWASDSLSFP